jgi:hypothetical protein
MNIGVAPRIVGVVTAIFTDNARLANHNHMLHSIRAQEDKLDDLLIGFSVNTGGGVHVNTTEVYGGKDLVRDGRHPSIAQRKITQLDADGIIKQYPSHFYQLKHLMEKYLPSTATEGAVDADWILFSTDDGIWHPRRVAIFRDAVQRMHADPSVTCVAFPSKRAEGDKKLTQRLETHAHVTEAIERGELRIYSWIPDEHSDERFELLPQDLCVRASVVREFFAKTSPELIQNSHCDVSFCASLMSGAVGGLGSRTHFQLHNTWTYYARPAERAYNYLTYAQFIECEMAFKNTFQMVPYVIRLAEMGDCPELAETAKASAEDLFQQLAGEPSGQAMLRRDYTRAQKEKPWLLLRRK